MTAQRGDLMVLKVGDGGSPETFTAVAGLRSTRLSINGNPIEVTNKSSGGWRELIAGGVRSMSLSADGVFLDDAEIERLRARAAAGSIDNYQIAIPIGSGATFDVWQGAFAITAFEESGDQGGEVAFSITLESAGAPTFTAG